MDQLPTIKWLIEWTSYQLLNSQLNGPVANFSMKRDANIESKNNHTIIHLDLKFELILNTNHA
jgi:hypothetical protein